MENAIRQDLGAGVAGNVRPDGEEAPSTRRCAPAQGETSRKVDGRRLRRKFTEAIWAVAAPEYFAGATAKEISEKYGMSLQTVHARFAGRGKRAPMA